MAWGKFYTFRATGSPKQNIPGRTTLYSPGDNFFAWYNLLIPA